MNPSLPNQTRGVNGPICKNEYVYLEDYVLYVNVGSKRVAVCTLE